jgi:hypothetical protein
MRYLCRETQAGACLARSTRKLGELGNHGFGCSREGVVRIRREYREEEK